MIIIAPTQKINLRPVAYLNVAQTDLEKVREKLDSYCGKSGSVPIGFVQKLIKDSAYWYDHPNGPVKAPKHYERVDRGPYGWQITFGKNAFLVELAVKRCADSVRGRISGSACNRPFCSRENLISGLDRHIRSAVSNFNGEEFPGLYPVVGGYMHFGAQAIHVREFSETFINVIGLGAVSD